jgi:uncharacterized protein
MEHPRFIEGHQSRLFSFLHEPESSRPELALVLSHPFGEEKLWSHRVLVSFARELVARGHAALRFDYMGAGDSEGELRDSSMETHMGDLRASINHLRARVGTQCRIGVAGLRLGATVAALLADHTAADSLIDGPLILWDPITNGDAYMQELLRSHLGTQLAVFGRVVEGRDALKDRMARGESVNLDGYDLASPLFDSCAIRELIPKSQHLFAGRTLVVQISAPGTGRARPDLAELASGYAKGTLATCIEEAFWKEIRPFYGRAENLQRETLEWLGAGGE